MLSYADVRARLDALVSSAIPLPDFTPRTISPDFAVLVAEEIVDTRPGQVVGLGGGIIAPVAGHALRKVGAGRLTAIEHDGDEYIESKLRLREHGLEDVVTLRHCPLAPCRAGDWQQHWYHIQPADLPPSIDLLIVAGPPRNLCPAARYPALPKLWDRLSADATILLEDAQAKDEMIIVRSWVKDYRLSHEFVPTSRGTSILRRTSKRR